MTFKCNVVLMFCLSMWTLNQAPDEILESQSVRVSHPKVTKTKLPRLQKIFVFRILLPCIEHTLYALYASKCHDTDFLMSWTDVDLFLVRSGKQSFLRKSSLCGSLPVDSQDGLQNFHGKQILNCWRPGRFKETDLANVGARSDEHMMNICENVRNQEPVINEKQIYARPNDTLHCSRWFFSCAPIVSIIV